MECGAPGVPGAAAASPVALGARRERDPAVILLQPMEGRSVLTLTIHTKPGIVTLRNAQVTRNVVLLIQLQLIIARPLLLYPSCLSTNCASNEL